MTSMTVAQLEAMRAAVLDNATDLILDAELLLSHGRVPRGYSLAVLACEELAKIPMLTRAAVDVSMERSVDWKKLAKRLRAHGSKLIQIEMVELIFNPATNDLDVFDSQFVRNVLKGERPRAVNEAKQDGFYVGFDGSGDPRSPKQAISAEGAERMLGSARQYLKLFQFTEGVLGKAIGERHKDPEWQAELIKVAEAVERFIHRLVDKPPSTD